MAPALCDVGRHLSRILRSLQLQIEAWVAAAQLVERRRIAPVGDLVNDAPRAPRRHGVQSVDRDALVELCLKLVPLAVSRGAHALLKRLRNNPSVQIFEERSIGTFLSRNFQNALAMLRAELKVQARVAVERKLQRLWPCKQGTRVNVSMNGGHHTRQ